MRKPFLKVSGTAATVLFGAACIIAPHPGESTGWRTVSRPETGNEIRETIDFRTGGTLSLENDFGDVVITGWDRDSVRIIAKAVASQARPQRSAREYGARTSEPDVEIRETDDGLLIRNRTFEGPGRPPEVAYEVRVPNSVRLTGIRISEGNLSVADVFGRLEASLDQGDLKVANYSGSVEAVIGTGEADVEVLDLREEDSITISSRKGDIVLRLESGTGAIVEADAPRGEVRSDFDLGVKMPVSTVKGWIGEGGPAIILRAADGRIEIVAVKRSAGDIRAAKGK
ncbi:MAG: hypothetical protein A2V57_08675 [Candidatus Aminicenantes bacterium RBG_19FT_COMBO_65_30]|nr:MAG: hypothetical protein A2V57_08675 [Candidatus Aminicenantes bacterium RBG_19FT_COMBO_65_30]